MKTVLIADDETYLRLLVRTTIESDEYRVIEASDGEQALKMVRLHRPDLVLLDLQMPGLTGLEVVDAINRDRTLNGTRVIVLTARSHCADRAPGPAGVVERYLAKPFSPIELLSALEAPSAPR